MAPTAKGLSAQIGSKYSYRYADLAAVWDDVRRALSPQGLAVAQTIVPGEPGLAVLETLLLHASGQWLRSHLPLRLESDPRLLGGQITYMRRYALMALVGAVAGGEDDDAQCYDRRPAPAPEPDYRAQVDQIVASIPQGDEAHLQAWARDVAAQIGQMPDWARQEIRGAYAERLRDWRAEQAQVAETVSAYLADVAALDTPEACEAWLTRWQADVEALPAADQAQIRAEWNRRVAMATGAAS